MRVLRSLPLVALLILFFGRMPLSGTWVSASEPTAADFFESRIRPVLVAHCYECHAADSDDLGGNLLLDHRAGLLEGGDSGPALVAGKPTESLILSAIRYEDFEMPPAGKLPDRVIADFQRWIETGAYDPRDAEPRNPRQQNSQQKIDLENAREFWAFRNPQLHPAPNVRNQDRVQRQLDAFVLAKLESEGLALGKPARRHVLIRRLALDLTGLLPQPADVQTFVQDNSPDAYERLVERLLASPQLGVRFARLWLDVARYAEDQAHIVGDNKSLFYPNAYLYRDWVTQALNEDLPIDQFIRQQLAADLISPDDPSDWAALGFVGLGPKYYDRGSPQVMAEEYEDRVDTVTRGLLGLTVACARCHDHKYDPIPTDDYYALAGVFASTQMFNRPLNDEVETKGNGQAKSPEQAMHVVRDHKPVDLPIHIRGDATNHGDVVARRFLQVLSDPSNNANPWDSGSGRRELAEAITSSDNPLTARVFVNRIWGAMFGQPIVATPSNFGELGSRPSHAELLDDLAVRFMQSGWSLKWLLREIVFSATYQQTSIADASVVRADPANRYLARMNRKRMSVEQWRDALLQSCGVLDSTVGGPSFQVSEPEARFRTARGYISRLELDPTLQLFDFPDPNAHSAWRSQTTTPLQKLFVLNSEFMHLRTGDFAQRLDRELSTTDDKVTRAYELLFSRPPTDDEAQLARRSLEQGLSWRQYLQVLMASNELLFID